MTIINKMSQHIQSLLGTLPFEYIDATDTTNGKYATLVDNITNNDYFWLQLNQIETNKYSAANIITTFLEDNDNYQLFLKDYAQLKLSALKYDYQFIPNYIKDKKKLIHFLQNADVSTNNNAFYWKPKQLKEVIDKICIGNTDENKKIIDNFLKHTNHFYKQTKVKIYLKTILDTKFENDTEAFEQYYGVQSKNNQLIIEMENTKVLCAFLDKKYLIKTYPLEGAEDLKDYLKMLKVIAAVIKNEFKLNDVKITEYNPNYYNIITLAPENFDYPIDNLWDPMVKQFLVLKDNTLQELSKFLKTFLLYESIDNKIPHKEEFKTLVKKLKL